MQALSTRERRQRKSPTEAIRSAWAPVKEYRTYLNLPFYGLMVAGMVYAAFVPAVQKQSRKRIRIGAGPLPEMGAGEFVQHENPIRRSAIERGLMFAHPGGCRTERREP